jgi:hypothetical protein
VESYNSCNKHFDYHHLPLDSRGFAKTLWTLDVIVKMGWFFAVRTDFEVCIY